MKAIKIFIGLFLSLSLLNSCDESEPVVTGAEGGLLDIKNPSINYIVGNAGPYKSALKVFQGEVKTVKIEVMKSFHNSDTVSNEVLFKTLEFVAPTATTFESFEFSFSELTEGLLIDGDPLPATDGLYSIGDYWEFRYLSTTSSGSVVQQNKTTKVTVATRFAGKYRCIDAAYYRIGVPTYVASDWPEETVIESVDATTYRVLEYMGPFNANEYYFSIDPATNIITYPPLTPDGDPQTGNGQPFITCADNLADMADVHCEDSNYAVLKDDGADLLYMSFGYYTAGSGPRTFYQVLEKIVE